MADLTKKQIEDLALLVFRNASVKDAPLTTFDHLAKVTQDVYRRIAVAVANKLGHSTPTNGLPQPRK